MFMSWHQETRSPFPGSCLCFLPHLPALPVKATALVVGAERWSWFEDRTAQSSLCARTSSGFWKSMIISVLEHLQGILPQYRELCFQKVEKALSIPKLLGSQHPPWSIRLTAELCVLPSRCPWTAPKSPARCYLIAGACEVHSGWFLLPGPVSVAPRASCAPLHGDTLPDALGKIPLTTAPVG